MKEKLVHIGEYGRRVGESHGRAKLTDHEVKLVRELKEGGMCAEEIAEKFEISTRHVYRLVNFRSRACEVFEFSWIRETLKRRKKV